LLAVTALLALSPWLRVRTVTWTGPLHLTAERYLALESAALGRPLLLLSPRGLRQALGLDARTTRISIDRHLPHTLEVRLTPRRAVAKLDAATPVDARGRLLPADHAGDGLPLLVGFEADGKRLAPEARRLLAVLHEGLESASLRPAEVRWQGDEVDLLLADSGCRVRLDAMQADVQLAKLRVFAATLGDATLPAVIDLRFAGQVVAREGGVSRGTRRAR
jgi:cell division septal protein FtsQ